MRQKKAKLFRRLTNLPSLNEQQKKRLEKLFARERRATKSAMPKNVAIFPSKRHKGESMDDYEARARKVNKARRMRKGKG